MHLTVQGAQVIVAQSPARVTMDARNKATAPGFGETLKGRGKATAPGSALGFGRRDRVVAKLCLLAFTATQHWRTFTERFLKEHERMDVELNYVLGLCLEKLVDSEGHWSSSPVYRAYPLWRAAAEGLPRVVELFLGLGAEVDGLVENRTALLTVSFYGDDDHIKVVQLLLDHGADPTFVSPDVWTPLDVARERGDLEAMAELLENHPRVRRALRKRTCAYCEGEGSIVQPPFQVCGGCMSRRYCSRDCQKAAWRSGHREACIFVPEL